MIQSKKILPIASIIACDLLLLAILWLGLYRRAEKRDKYVTGNTVCFFYERAEYLNVNGRYQKIDRLSYAPNEYPENYPPGVAYASVLTYRLTKWVHHLNFREYMSAFPLIVYAVIVFTGYWIMSRLYSRAAGLAFASIFSMANVSTGLTLMSYFTSEALGVFLCLISIYTIIKIPERPLLWAAAAVVSMTCLELTWQLFIPLLALIAVMAAVYYKNIRVACAYLAVIFVPLIAGHVISTGIVGIHYSPFYVIRELAIGVAERHTDAYALVLARKKLNPMTFMAFVRQFARPAAFFLAIGLAYCLRYRKQAKYLFPIIGCLAGIYLVTVYVKFRYIALPFIFMTAAIGFHAVYYFDIESAAKRVMRLLRRGKNPQSSGQA